MLRIPAWFPGASWKRHGLRLREGVERVGTEPYEDVKAAIVSRLRPSNSLREY